MNKRKYVSVSSLHPVTISPAAKVKLQTPETIILTLSDVKEVISDNEDMLKLENRQDGSWQLYYRPLTGTEAFKRWLKIIHLEVFWVLGRPKGSAFVFDPRLEVIIEGQLETHQVTVLAHAVKAALGLTQRPIGFELVEMPIMGGQPVGGCQYRLATELPGIKNRLEEFFGQFS